MTAVEIFLCTIIGMSLTVNYGFGIGWYSSSSQAWLRHQMGIDGADTVHPWAYFNYVRQHSIARNVGVQVNLDSTEGPNDVGVQVNQESEQSVDVVFIELEGRRVPVRGVNLHVERRGHLDNRSNQEGVENSLGDQFEDVAFLGGSTSTITPESVNRGAPSGNIRNVLSDSLIERRGQDQTLSEIKVETPPGASRGGRWASINQGEALRENKVEIGVLRENKVEIDEVVGSTFSSIPLEVEGMMAHVWNQFDMVFNILADKPLVGCIFFSYQLLRITNQMPNPRVYRWFALVYLLFIFVLLMV